MAEAIVRGTASRIESISCGTKTLQGYPATINARRVVKERNWDLENHASKPINSEIVEEYTLICMTNDHRNFLKKKYPDGRIFLLTEIGSGTGDDIIDPVGKNLSEYRKTLKILENEITIILEKWK